jgi:sugar phosphate isomerase/epimerase
MIYVSSTCAPTKNLREAIDSFVAHSIRNIEFSGGLDFYESFLDNLFSLKEVHRLNLLVHNYFPPPKDAFVLNLASQDNEIYQRSLEHYKQSIELAIRLGAPVYALHAGFLMDPQVNELGRPIAKRHLQGKAEAIQRFLAGFAELEQLYGKQIRLYIENNVVSAKNFETYGTNPSLLASFADYQEMAALFPFRPLLDLGHLQVSCKSLDLDFESEASQFFAHTDYIHLSANDGKSDQNLLPRKEDAVCKALKKYYIPSMTVTLEIYQSLDEIQTLYREMESWT